MLMLIMQEMYSLVAQCQDSLCSWTTPQSTWVARSKDWLKYQRMQVSKLLWRKRASLYVDFDTRSEWWAFQFKNQHSFHQRWQPVRNVQHEWPRINPQKDVKYCNAFHSVCEGSAREEWWTAYINTHVNPADMMTKPLPSGAKRTLFVCMILHHLWCIIFKIVAE